MVHLPIFSQCVDQTNDDKDAPNNGSNDGHYSEDLQQKLLPIPATRTTIFRRHFETNYKQGSV